jgi:hypothetical protein
MVKKSNNLKISFDMETEINAILNAVKDYKPISIENLKKENQELYNLVFFA